MVEALEVGMKVQSTGIDTNLSRRERTVPVETNQTSRFSVPTDFMLFGYFGVKIRREVDEEMT